jgi:hypothetical protein
MQGFAWRIVADGRRQLRVLPEGSPSDDAKALADLDGRDGTEAADEAR